MDMRISFDGAAAMLLLGLPWLLLAFVAWRATRGVEAKRADGRTRGHRSAYMAHGVVSEPISRPDSGHVAVAMSASEFTMFDNSGLQLASGSYSELNIGAGPVTIEELTDRIPSLSLEQQERALLLALATAKSERDDAALSRNSVLLARILLSRSARGEAAALLQSAALSARRAKSPVLHAEARIELAELARSDGDMTTACEHWQMAKVMFHETGQRPDQDRISDLMRQHRCPTDWVLTNF